MAELSPIERVTRFFNREPIDVMPFFTGMGMVLAPAIEKLGYKFASIHRESAEKLAWAGIESARMFNLDSIVIPFDMCWESEALGNEISLYEESEEILYPTIPEKNWNTIDEVNHSEHDRHNNGQISHDIASRSHQDLQKGSTGAACWRLAVRTLYPVRSNHRTG